MFSIWPRINAYNYNARHISTRECVFAMEINIHISLLILIILSFMYLIETWCIHVYPYIIYHVYVYEICIHTCNLIKIFIWYILICIQCVMNISEKGRDKYMYIHIFIDILIYNINIKISSKIINRLIIFIYKTWCKRVYYCYF